MLWLFISFLISSLYEADMTQALIVEPFDHPFDFASILRLNYTILLLEKHPEFYNKTLKKQSIDSDDFTKFWFTTLTHSMFLGYVTVKRHIKYMIIF